MEVRLSAKEIREAIKQYVGAQTDLKVMSVVVYGSHSAVVKVLAEDLTP